MQNYNLNLRSPLLSQSYDQNITNIYKPKVISRNVQHNLNQSYSGIKIRNLSKNKFSQETYVSNNSFETFNPNISQIMINSGQSQQSIINLLDKLSPEPKKNVNKSAVLDSVNLFAVNISFGNEKMEDVHLKTEYDQVFLSPEFEQTTSIPSIPQLELAIIYNLKSD
jgi:hypothetical protein